MSDNALQHTDSSWETVKYYEVSNDVIKIIISVSFVLQIYQNKLLQIMFSFHMRSNDMRQK